VEEFKASLKNFNLDPYGVRAPSHYTFAQAINTYETTHA
jgi:hypothetical protein